ncbi:MULTISPECIES: MATE family efflux transporter [unclassified Oceanobacter]|uniref:MATE family efflux transporter n=1 Tax=unclassified Oceanobacter TaxID=2620260 RepID=UPI0027331F8C|nr:MULTISPECIES: MATE family efflux transporter [unclassified Oceanobacter]MDP2609327.1 MATE family efflux transporter [Oceanobacter sp. 1_MG-2023]MDP2612576.1 MATE family efflux transporter [Oceanobacter sp. 2_MG-2023]
MSFVNRETRALFKLTLPIMATQMAQIGMGTVDTLMSGYVSTQDLAAVAIGTSLWLPVWLFLAGILVALSPLVSGLNASKQHQQLSSLLASSVWLGAIAGSLIGLLLYFAADMLPLLIDDTVTAALATRYLVAISIGFPAVGVFLAFRFYAEALSQATHVTWIMLSGLIANVPVNAVFVYGWLGFPEMGSVGCGIGSSLIFVCMAIAMAINTRKYRLGKEASLLDLMNSPAWHHVRNILRIGVPIGIAIFFEVSLFTAIALFLTDLGPVVVAGHQVALNMSSITFMIPLSLGMALTVRVGHYLGSGDTLLARQTAWLGVRLNLAIALFNATLIILLSETIAGWYSPDPEVVAIGSVLLVYAAVFQLSDATQVAAAGALRGYQDTFVVMLITFVTYWLVGLGCGYGLAFHGIPLLNIAPAGAPGFWTGLVIGLSAAALALSLRLKRVSRLRPAAL